MYITYNHVCFLLQSGRDLDRTHTMARHNSAEWKWDGFWLTYKSDRSKTIEALQCHTFMCGVGDFLSREKLLSYTAKTSCQVINVIIML